MYRFLYEYALIIFFLDSDRSPGARRGLKKNRENDGANSKNLDFKNLFDRMRSLATIDRKYEPTLSDKDFLIDHDSNIKSALNAHSPIDMRRVYSGSPNALTDGEQHRIPSTVSVRKTKRADLESVDNVEKFHESKTAYLQSTNDDDHTGKNSNRIEPQIASLQTTVKQKNVPVHITKIPRHESSRDQRSRALSAGKLYVTHADGSSTELETTATRVKTSMSTSDRTGTTGSAIRASECCVVIFMDDRSFISA